MLLLLLFLGAVLISVNLAFYWRYLRATWTPPPRRILIESVRWVPSQTMLKLGWLTAEKNSSFIHYDRNKPVGVVRVGCLGDSFTHGDEVNRSEDYPAILQRLFRERGYPQVEVINFGSGWYGFSQTFTLWNDVARGFNLDYVLLGPHSFYSERDTTFDHSSPTTIHFLHARHVLEGAGVGLIDVVGNTFANRTAAYRRFIPYWRYLRYDRRAPAFLACLAPPGKELPNPFYYQKDIKWELGEIYRRLLLQMAASGTQIVLGNYDPRIVELGRRLGRDNLYPVKLEKVESFPYRAPKGHASPSGNRLLAEQFFAIITGRREYALPMITVNPLSESRAFLGRGPARSLDIYERVIVGLEEGKPWRFVEIAGGMKVPDLSPDFLRRYNVKSLLALRTSEQLLPETLFYPLSMELREGMPLSLRSSKGELALGRVSLLRPDLQVGIVDLSGALGRAADRPFHDVAAFYTRREPLNRYLPGQVYLGELPIFQVLPPPPDKKGQVGLHPIRRRFLKIYAPPELLGKGYTRREGVLSLRFESKLGPPVSVPLAAWRRPDKEPVARFDSPGIQRPMGKPFR